MIRHVLEHEECDIYTLMPMHSSMRPLIQFSISNSVVVLLNKVRSHISIIHALW